MDIKIDPHLELVLQFIGANVPEAKRLFIADNLSNFCYSLWGSGGSCEGEDDDQPDFRMVYDAEATSDPIVEAHRREYKTPGDEDVAALKTLREAGIPVMGTMAGDGRQ